jgi:hypothetical protein
MPSPAAATNLFPSADETTETQDNGGVSVAVHDAPELVERKIELVVAAATSFAPSCDEATDTHSLPGRLFETHVAPESAEV